MAGMEDYRRQTGTEYYEGTIQRPTDLPVSSRTSQRSDRTDEQEAIITYNDAVVKRYTGMGVGVASLITENLLSHPFVVLRRQCQVHVGSRRYHITPFTLLPVVVHLHQCQGVTTLWKGLGSALVIRGMSLAIEDFISKMTPWPKEINQHSSLKSVGQHLLLKCIGLAVVTPFYSASLVETVQSDIASEKPGIFDVFKEGACRLLSWGSPQKGRMLPIWALVVPTVVYGVVKYLITLVVHGSASKVLRAAHREEQNKRGAIPRNSYDNQYIELRASLLGHLTADIILFPMETVLHRIHLQGTRTIIDSLDSGYEVTPILTSYVGARDCFRSTLASEGVLGLYKGFGALMLQYAAHLAVIKITKFMLAEVISLMKTAPPPQVALRREPTPEERSPQVAPTRPSYVPLEGYEMSHFAYRQQARYTGSSTRERSPVTPEQWT